MYKREVLTNLRNWSKKKNRKPLVLRGARQVGKTTLINDFGKEFDHYLYLNLELKLYRCFAIFMNRCHGYMSLPQVHVFSHW